MKKSFTFILQCCDKKRIHSFFWTWLENVFFYESLQRYLSHQWRDCEKRKHCWYNCNYRILWIRRLEKTILFEEWQKSELHIIKIVHSRRYIWIKDSQSNSFEKYFNNEWQIIRIDKFESQFIKIYCETWYKIFTSHGRLFECL